MGLYPADGPYLHLMGGRYIGHGPLERFRVDVVDTAHPIARGVASFFVADEQHTPPYDEERVHLLLRSRSDDGKIAAAGWAREQGRGRLCHLANGHTLEALLHPMYQRLMSNAVRWCLRLEVADAIPRHAGLPSGDYQTGDPGIAAANGARVVVCYEFSPFWPDLFGNADLERSPLDAAELPGKIPHPNVIIRRSRSEQAPDPVRREGHTIEPKRSTIKHGSWFPVATLQRRTIPSFPAEASA